MSYKKSAILGLVVGVVLGIIGLIPFVGALNCVLSPLAALAAGYYLVGELKIRKDDWKLLAINSAVFSAVAAVIGLVFNIVGLVSGLGLSAVGGSSAQSIVIGAGLGIGAVIFGAIVGFVYTLVLAVVGGAIRMYTAK